MNSSFKYKWFSKGDIQGAFSIIFDNFSNLAALSAILIFGFHLPKEIVLSHIVPNTVIGLIVGNLLYVFLAFKKSYQENRQAIAIPFGLDAPSTIGFALFIIGPMFAYLKQHGINDYEAGIISWKVGVCCTFTIGIIKLLIMPIANRIYQITPQEALLGAIGGVGIAIMGIFSLLSIFKSPIVGMISLAIIFLSMFAKMRLPFNIPSVLAAIVVGTIVYYVMIPLGIGNSVNLDDLFKISMSIPNFSFDFLQYHDYAIRYIGISVPFALLVIFGTMAVSKSAECMGEHYSPRTMLSIDGLATLVTSMFGGVSQTTAYAGIVAYQKMGVRSGYLILNGLFVGFGGILGIVSLVVSIVPQAALGPVILFIGIEIVMQGFVHCDKKYYPAILFSILPSILRIIESIISDGSLVSLDALQDISFKAGNGISSHLAILLLGNGFIITGMLWASTLCFAIDKKWISSFVCCLILSLLSYFGIIHSVFISGQIYWNTALPDAVKTVPLQLALGYLALGIIILVLSRFQHDD